MIVYLDGNFLPLAEARISPMDRGFLFADGVYEVVRAYGGRWFRMDLHVRRLERSMRAIGLEGFEAGQLGLLGDELLAANGGVNDDALLYLQVTRGCDAVRSHFFSGGAPTVYAMVRLLPRDRDPEPPARVVVLEDRRWERCDIKSVALLGNVLAANQARSRGAGEAVLHRDGVVTEGAAVNVAAVIDGVVRTHPESPRILSGISRRVVLDICREEGIECREEAFVIDELRTASEVFLTGTTHEVWPVASLDGGPVPVGGEGSVTRRLIRCFRRLARSRPG